jgi:hypothetical protein
LQKLKDLENRLIELRNTDALSRWNELQKQGKIYLENKQYDKAVRLIPDIDKYAPYLPNSVQTESEHLVSLIKNENEEWEKYRTTFKAIEIKFLTAVKDSAVNSSIVGDSYKSLSKLEKYAQKFIKDYKIQTKVSVERDIILPIEKRLQVIDYLLNTGRLFSLKKLEELKQNLLQRCEELKKIPYDAKIWNRNPKYFKKYLDHPKALLFLNNLKINNSIKFKEAYELILAIRNIKRYTDNKTKKIFENKIVRLVNILIKKRFGNQFTKEKIVKQLLKDGLYKEAVFVTKKINNIKKRDTYLKMILKHHIDWNTKIDVQNLIRKSNKTKLTLSEYERKFITNRKSGWREIIAFISLYLISILFIYYLNIWALQSDVVEGILSLFAFLVLFGMPLVFISIIKPKIFKKQSSDIEAETSGFFNDMAEGILDIFQVIIIYVVCFIAFAIFYGIAFVISEEMSITIFTGCTFFALLLLTVRDIVSLIYKMKFKTMLKQF